MLTARFANHKPRNVGSRNFFKIARAFAFEHWADLPDGRCAIRLVTSWATTPEDARRLADALKEMGNEQT